jgi:HK97 family phage portal protein
LYTIPGRILGLSPIKAYAKTIDQGLLAQNFGVDWFRNGTVPAGMLTSDQRVLDSDAETISARWRRSAAGRGTPVVGQGLVYKAISVPPEESQFLQTIKASATQVAAIYHLPPELIGGESGKSMTYTNVDGYPIMVARFALTDYVKRIEDALTGYLPRPQSARFNMDAFQRPDQAARFQSYALALQNQWMTVDEVRQAENLKPFGDSRGGLITPPAKTIGGSPPAVAAAPKNDTPNDGVGKGLPNPEPKNTGVGQGAVDSHSLNGNGHSKALDPRQLVLALVEREDGWN